MYELLYFFTNFLQKKILAPYNVILYVISISNVRYYSKLKCMNIIFSYMQPTIILLSYIQNIKGFEIEIDIHLILVIHPFKSTIFIR